MPHHRVPNQYAMHRGQSSLFDPDDDDDMPSLVDAPPGGHGHTMLLFNRSVDDQDEDDDMPPLVEAPAFPTLTSPFNMFDHMVNNDDADDMPPLVEAPLFTDDNGSEAQTGAGLGGMVYTFATNVTPGAFRVADAAATTASIPIVGDTMDDAYTSGALVLAHSSPNVPPSPPPESPTYSSSPTPSPVFPSAMAMSVNAGSNGAGDNGNGNRKRRSSNDMMPPPSTGGITYNFSLSSSPDAMGGQFSFESRFMGTADTTPSNALMLPPPDPSANYPNPALTPPTTNSHGRKRPASYIPRPPNAFILFRASFVKENRIPASVEGNHSNLSKIAGEVWKKMRKEERERWEREAREKVEEHRRMYPDWRFRLAGGNGNGGGGGAGGGLGKVKDGTGIGIGEEGRGRKRGGVGTGTRRGGAGGKRSRPNSGTEETLLHQGASTSAVDATSASEESTAQAHSQQRKRRNSTREASEDEERLRQRRCAKIVDLLGEGKSGAELAMAVEAFDRSEAVTVKGEVARKEGEAGLISGIGIEMGRLEKVERVERELQAQREKAQAQAQAPTSMMAPSAWKPGRKRAETVSRGRETITSIVPMGAVVTSSRESGKDSKDALALASSKSTSTDVGASTPPIPSNSSNTSNDSTPALPTSLALRTNSLPSPHLLPPPTPLPPPSPSSPPPSSPPADARFSVPLTAVGRRSSSAPPTRKRVPGVGYEVEGDGDENESALGAEANGLGPSPFSAFLGGGVKKKEKLKKSDAVVANGKSIDGKGQRKRGDEPNVSGKLSTPSFSTYANSSGDSNTMAYAFNELDPLPTLPAVYAHSHGERPVQNAPHQENGNSLVNVSSYSTLTGWAGANAENSNINVFHSSPVSGATVPNGMSTGFYRPMDMQAPTSAYNSNTNMNASTAYRNMFPSSYLLSHNSTQAHSAIPMMSSLTPMPMAPSAPSASAALHGQHQHQNPYNTAHIPQFSSHDGNSYQQQHQSQSNALYTNTAQPSLSDNGPQYLLYARARPAMQHMYSLPTLSSGPNPLDGVNGLSTAVTEGELGYPYGR